MFEGFSTRTINVGDAQISCVIGGAGAPVLLLHGFPQTKAMWARASLFPLPETGWRCTTKPGKRWLVARLMMRRKRPLRGVK